jgi:vitamin-K-epoxide reductase (warfarin-sensitive)
MRSVIAVLSVAGIVASCFALAAHYSAPVQPIDLLGSKWNSEYVNQSSYSEVHGIPVAVLGISGYALLVILALLRRRVLTVYFAGIGVAYAFYLTNIEAHILQVWCVYCVSSQILILAIAILAFGTLIFDPTPDPVTRPRQ